MAKIYRDTHKLERFNRTLNGIEMCIDQVLTKSGESFNRTLNGIEISVSVHEKRG